MDRLVEMCENIEHVQWYYGWIGIDTECLTHYLDSSRDAYITFIMHVQLASGLEA